MMPGITISWKLTSGFIVLIFCFRIFGYLFTEFVIQNNVNVVVCDTCSMKYKNSLHGTDRIPDIIHQIYFPINKNKISSAMGAARISWLENHPKFKHYLWNETAILQLVNQNYPYLVTLYGSYNRWVSRVDLAKYVSLHHYGGWYVDLGIASKKSVTELSNAALRQNKSVVQHLASSAGPGTSNDFIGATKEHQFLQSVIDALPNSNRWFIFPYLSTILSTGPTFIWGRYLNYPYKEEFLILDQKEIAKYIQNQHASTWHNWDALFIRFVARNIYFITFLILCLYLLRRTISHVYVRNKSNDDSDFICGGDYIKIKTKTEH